MASHVRTFKNTDTRSHGNSDTFVVFHSPFEILVTKLKNGDVSFCDDSENGIGH